MPKFRNEWGDIKDGLEFLFKILEGKMNNIQSLSQIHKAIWWCGHFQKSFDGGPLFSIEIINELSRFGIPLYLDCYFEEGN